MKHCDLFGPFLPFCTPVLIGPQVVPLVSFNRFSVGSEIKTEKRQPSPASFRPFKCAKYQMDCSLNYENQTEERGDPVQIFATGVLIFS